MLLPRRSIPKRRIPRRLAAVCLALPILAFAYLWITTDLPTPTRLRARAALGDTRLLDRTGRLIAAIPDPLGTSRQPVALDHIPITLQQATIAIEDANFYQNVGIEPRGILRAIWQNLANGEIVAGGSTITQQLARAFLLDPAIGRQRSFDRKLREAIVALKLTTAYSKDEILTLYLNQIYYGGTAYGVESAAWRLFGKPVHELDLAESALLAGLPQAPSQLDPLSNGDLHARERQRLVLAAMVRTGYISSVQAEMAAAEPLQYADGACRTGTCTASAPHFVAFVLDDLVERLGADSLARGGLTITTTLDIGLQEAAQAILKRQIDLLAQPRDGGPDHRARNGAVITLDPADGAILAMVGSPDFADPHSQGQVNATTALRQPGSALKPLTYAAALERGWTPASMVLDVPTSFPTREGRPYTPQNYDRAYHGPIPLREALATSSNIAAVRLLHEIGLQSLLDMAERLGIHSLGQDPSRYGLALTLGGGEVTLLELTNAYAAFANGGNRVTPYAVLALSDAEGQAVNVSNTTNNPNDQSSMQTIHSATQSTRVAPVSVLSPQIAYLISDILADPYARMRAFGLESTLDIGRPAAAKTGTTTDWRDNWTVGYTPDRVVGVWVGNADGSPMEAVSGITGAGPVWRAVMQAAHRDLPVHAFTRPAGLVEADICSDSGLLPGPHCPATRRELFIAGTVPNKPDNTHVALRVDLHLGCRALPGYPPEKTAMRIFHMLPPEAQLWAIDAGVPVAPRKICPLPGAITNTSNPSQTDAAENDRAAPRIVAPAYGAVFALSPGIPSARQRLEIAAQAGNSIVQLTIIVDGVAVANFSGPPYRTFWKLTPGQHTIIVKARDQQGHVLLSETSTYTVEGLR